MKEELLGMLIALAFIVVIALGIILMSAESCAARAKSTDVVTTDYKVMGGCFLELNDGTMIHVDDYWIEGQR